MYVEVITPEGTVFSSDARQVVLPGALSPFAIMDLHQAIVSSLLEGAVRITLPDDRDVWVEIGPDSVVEQHEDRVRVLASSASLRHDP